MSWDVYIQDFHGVESLENLPDNWKPGSIGDKADIIARILSVFPTSDFSDPSWGVLNGDGFSIEFNIGKDDPVQSIMLHVRGSDKASVAVLQIMEVLGHKALDTSTGQFIGQTNAQVGISTWRAFRNKILGTD